MPQVIHKITTDQYDKYILVRNNLKYTLFCCFESFNFIKSSFGVYSLTQYLCIDRPLQQGEPGRHAAGGSSCVQTLYDSRGLCYQRCLHTQTHTHTHTDSPSYRFMSCVLTATSPAISPICLNLCSTTSFHRVSQCHCRSTAVVEHIEQCELMYTDRVLQTHNQLR